MLRCPRQRSWRWHCSQLCAVVEASSKRLGRQFPNWMEKQRHGASCGQSVEVDSRSELPSHCQVHFPPNNQPRHIHLPETASFTYSKASTLSPKVSKQLASSISFQTTIQIRRTTPSDTARSSSRTQSAMGHLRRTSWRPQSARTFTSGLILMSED